MQHKRRRLNFVDDAFKAFIPGNIKQGMAAAHSLKQYGIKHTAYRGIGHIANTVLGKNVVSLGMMPQWIQDTEKSDVVKKSARIKQFQKTTRSHNENPSAYDHMRASQFAHEAYKVPNQRVRHLHGYTLSERESDVDIAVYRNRSGGVQLGIKGTDPTNIRDLSADANIAMGMSDSSDFYQNVRNKVEKILDRHNRIYSRENTNAHVDIVGQSLAGRAVHDLMKEPHIADSIRGAFSFAPGGSPMESSNPRETQELSERQIKHLHTHLTNSRDFLSLHDTPGTYMQGKIYQHEFGHIHWDDTDDLDYWDDYEGEGSLMEPLDESIKEELRR